MGFSSGIVGLPNSGKATPFNILDGHVKIRQGMKPGDIGNILYLHGVLYNIERGWNHLFEAYVADSLSKFALTYNEDSESLWIAESGQNIAGSIGVVDRTNNQAQLRWFIVHPEMRGKGLGKNLLDAALSFCKLKGFNNVFLWTVSELPVAAHIYESYGFKITEEKTHRIWDMVTEIKYERSL